MWLLYHSANQHPLETTPEITRKEMTLLFMFHVYFCFILQEELLYLIFKASIDCNIVCGDVVSKKYELTVVKLLWQQWVAMLRSPLGVRWIINTQVIKGIWIKEMYMHQLRTLSLLKILKTIVLFLFSTFHSVTTVRYIHYYVYDAWHTSIN